MQTEGYRSKSTMVGVGLVATVLISASAFMACSPGALDCEAFDCEGTATGGTGGTRPVTGGTGGTGGTPMAQGGSGGGAAPMVTAMTAVPGCTKFPTLGAMDMFFSMRCGTTNACHGTGAPWSDFKAANVWMRMLEVKAKTICSSDKMIDRTNPANSLILVKVKQMMPKCPTGGAAAGATTMPPPGNAEKIPSPLPMDEVVCLENFVKAAAGK